MQAREGLLELLAQGVSPVQAAAAVGVTESYVSQLLSDEDFAADVESRKVARTEQDLKYDQKIDAAEEVFLDNIERKASFANLQQSLHAFKVLNGAKRRKDSRVGAGSSGPAVVVNLVLPAQFIPQHVINANNEIVEVDGRTMVSAAPKKLEEMVQRRNPQLLEAPKPPEFQEISEQARRARTLETLETAQATQKPKMRKLTQKLPSDLLDLL